MPDPPAGLLEVSRSTWETWFKAWWAAHWTTDDLPGLRLLIRIYDRVARGDVRRLSELRQLMDCYGITPKGQQDRRWLRPEPPRTNASPRPGMSVRERFGKRDPRDLLYRRQDPRKLMATLHGLEAKE
jgi:hypothetical protein